MTDGQWNCDSGAAEYGGDGAYRWDYTVSRESEDGTIEIKGWDQAYEYYNDSYTLNSVLGFWDLTGTFVSGDGDYGYVQTITNPDPYTANGSHDGCYWSVEGTSSTNEGAGVEYDYQGTSLYLFGECFYDGGGWITYYVTSGSTYSGQGEYGIDDEEVDGTVTASGSNQFRFDSTTDYVLDEYFGTWEIDQYRRATSSVGDTEWSYSVADSEYTDSDVDSDWSVSGVQYEGETYHTAYESYLAEERAPDGDWTYDLDRSFTTYSFGMSSDSSYSATGTYTHGTITGTVEAEGERTYDVTYIDYSSLNANGSWGTSTASRTVSEVVDESWSYEGTGEYTRSNSASSSGNAYYIDGTIDEYGQDTHTVEFEATSTCDENGNWTTTGNGRTLCESESGYSYSGSGDLLLNSEWWFDGVYYSRTNEYSAAEQGSGSVSEHDVEYWELAGGEWSSIGEDYSSHGESAHSFEYREDYSGTTTNTYPIEQTYPQSRTRVQSQEINEESNTTGVGVEATSWSSISGSGEATHVADTGYFYDFEGNYFRQEIDASDSWSMQPDEDNSVHGTYTNNTTDTNPEFDDYYIERSYNTTISDPGFYGGSEDYGPYCDPFGIGSAPLSGYTGTQSHTFDEYDSDPPSLLIIPSDGTPPTLSVAIAPSVVSSLAMETAGTPNAYTAAALFQPVVYDGSTTTTATTATTTTTSGFTSYDANGNVSSVTNSNGDTTRFTYDAAGNVTTVLDAAQNMTQWAYDDDGQVTEGNQRPGR